MEEPNDIYRETTLGTCLKSALQEMVQSGEMTEDMVEEVWNCFDKTFVGTVKHLKTLETETDKTKQERIIIAKQSKGKRKRKMFSAGDSSVASRSSPGNSVLKGSIKNFTIVKNQFRVQLENVLLESSEHGAIKADDLFLKAFSSF
uniref:Transcription initiation factor IIA gamma subunit N-terminal domain-containing protein n=1 Tax=Aplanochytrium stocchinoi TaxID=215587 RepID=A0A7S3PHN3_9STRA|mmetsp:Transcript_14599/g.18040  ORF Transcript_14599/g.18040 Transcript_14599/m.18040 type:complete len:146 (-) Transcript_14599:312-749(-)